LFCILSGIGYETAKFIAMMGANVIIACRSEEKAKQVVYRSPRFAVIESNWFLFFTVHRTVVYHIISKRGVSI